MPPAAAAKPRRLVQILVACVALCAALWAGLAVYERATGVNVFVKYGDAFWIPVSESSPWLPRSVRLALHRPPPAAAPGAIVWRTPAPGFEVAELPVLSNGEEVDRIFLARIDPARYRFEVRNDPSGGRRLEDWMRTLHAVLVINGSYFGRDGRPATPVVIDGRPAGPSSYQASQGAFVSSPAASRIVDLSHADWRAALGGARAAMVSYPLLLAEDGSNRAPRDTGWLANRSFVGEDVQGRIVLGTTQSAFFSLDRLGDFLKQARLDLTLALDLDGGPVACQGISLAGFHRAVCGTWELERDARGHAKMLPAWPGAHAGMPMVLAVFPRAPR
jgi:hypothetical protein